MANAPWYKAGTVSLTQGQATVTGNGTGWLKYINQGDAFMAPDGRAYEVNAVASDTSLTLASTYAGQTVNGSAYGIMRNFTGQLPADLAAGMQQLLQQFASQNGYLWAQGQTYSLTDGNGNTLTLPTLLSLNTTQPQFDKTTKLATTEFVQRAIGSFQSGFETSSAMKLAASDVGKWINLAGTVPFAVTLPALDSVPDGATFLFHNDAAGVAHTLIPAGSDRFAAAGLAYSTMTIGHGEFAIVTKAATVWRTAGSATLKYEAQFGSSLAGNGWQRLPSGLIIQWGGASVSGTLTLTMPMAFPNAGISVWATGQTAADAVVGGSCWVEGSFVSPSQIFLKTIASSSSGNTLGARGVSWLAIGR